MLCQGACQKHCYCSKKVYVLAYAALLYLGSSLVYLVGTTCLAYGTPFKDTLTVGQRRVLDGSKQRRRALFAAGVAITSTILCATRPLRSPSRNVL
tara:strand:+ start:543 stop:830 length:288 start_codon:yes stop_codon:yes gene_type:complete